MKFDVMEVEAKEAEVELLSFNYGDKIVLKLEADCCSESYFTPESMELLRSLEGETITSLERVASERPGGGIGGRQESTCWHALLVRTNKRSFTVDWRNDSNGYYDGSLTITTIEKGE